MRICFRIFIFFNNYLLQQLMVLLLEDRNNGKTEVSFKYFISLKRLSLQPLIKNFKIPEFKF